MSSDRLVNFLYLFSKWSSVKVPKMIIISFMIIIATIIGVILLGDESENRTEMESTLSLLVNIMIFVAGIGFGIIVIVPMYMNKLQEKV